MVAQVTNHDTDYIRRKMKYADALMYRTFFCVRNEIPFASHESKPKPLME